MRRQRLADGSDGGYDGLRRLAAQPAVNGAPILPDCRVSAKLRFLFFVIDSEIIGR
jgi:hypothetical protein